MVRRPVVEVRGAAQLRRAMRRAAHDVGELRVVNAEAAGIASTAARVAAPRLSGRLAGSVRPGATRTQALVRVGSSAIPYANPVHWGWPSRHIAPHPFAAEAAQHSEPTWLPLYEAAIQRLVNRIAQEAHP